MAMPQRIMDPTTPMSYGFQNRWATNLGYPAFDHPPEISQWGRMNPESCLDHDWVWRAVQSGQCMFVLRRKRDVEDCDDSRVQGVLGIRTLQTGSVESRQKFCLEHNISKKFGFVDAHASQLVSLRRTWKFPNCVDPISSLREALFDVFVVELCSTLRARTTALSPDGPLDWNRKGFQLSPRWRSCVTQRRSKDCDVVAVKLNFLSSLARDFVSFGVSCSAWGKRDLAATVW